jgi:hypothetical protein
MSDQISRQQCIKINAICKGVFFVADNPTASGEQPFYELPTMSPVNSYSTLIDKIAVEKNVDARLIKAIMYMETTHGYYDAPLSLVGKNKSILPMNINVEYWGDTFGSREDLLNPEKNIRAGAEMINRIEANLPPGAPIEKIATLYNHINAGCVNNYGARVRKIYDDQPWLVSTQSCGLSSGARLRAALGKCPEPSK